MKSNALKLELIQWLAALEDKNILAALSFYKKNTEKSDWWHEMSDDQKRKIEKGLADIKAGRVKSSKEVWSKYGRKSAR